MCLLIDAYASSGVQGVSTKSIYNCYAVPKKFFLQDVVNPPYYEIYDGLTQAPIIDNYEISKPTSLDGYTPINNKLLTFPYCYLVESNNTGSQNILHYEKFKVEPDDPPDECRFNISGVPVVGGSIKCTPTNYTSGYGYSEIDSIIAGKFPTFNWNENTYADWLLTNASSLNVQGVQGATTTALSAMSAVAILAGITATVVSGGTLTPLMIAGSVAGFGASASGIFSGLGQISSAIATDTDHQYYPNSAVGMANAGDINFCQGLNTFIFYKYSIKKEYAKIIDDYFSMFGYKVNSSEVPNLHTRTNWNFLKVIEPNVESNVIPDNDLNEYKQMLQNGITFWHNYSTFRDYSQTNSIIV